MFDPYLFHNWENDLFGNFQNFQSLLSYWTSPILENLNFVTLCIPIVHQIGNHFDEGASIEMSMKNKKFALAPIIILDTLLLFFFHLKWCISSSHILSKFMLHWRLSSKYFSKFIYCSFKFIVLDEIHPELQILNLKVYHLCEFLAFYKGLGFRITKTLVRDVKIMQERIMKKNLLLYWYNLTSFYVVTQLERLSWLMKGHTYSLEFMYSVLITLLITFTLPLVQLSSLMK